MSDEAGRRATRHAANQRRLPISRSSSPPVAQRAIASPTSIKRCGSASAPIAAARRSAVAESNRVAAWRRSSCRSCSMPRSMPKADALLVAKADAFFAALLDVRLPPLRHAIHQTHRRAAPGRGRRYERRVGAIPIGCSMLDAKCRGAGGGQSDASPLPMWSRPNHRRPRRQVAQRRKSTHEQA